MGHKPDKDGFIRYSQWIPGASDVGPDDEPRSHWEKLLREEAKKGKRRKQLSELQNAANRPVAQVWTALKLSSESRAAAVARFPESKTTWRNDADAYRHFRWNYAMTQALGKEAAEAFGTSHEVDDEQPADDRNMDLQNNRLGRAMAMDPRFKHLTPDEAAELALGRGWLHRVK